MALDACLLACLLGCLVAWLVVWLFVCFVLLRKDAGLDNYVSIGHIRVDEFEGFFVTSRTLGDSLQ